MKTTNEKYGPWAVVTGATDGIGQAMTALLAQKAFNLVLIGRREEILQKNAKELSQKFGIEVVPLAIDLSTPQAMKKIETSTQHLDVGLFIAAAGFGSSGEFTTLPIANELNMIDVNCKAMVEQTHFFANKMKQKKRGGIILFSSLVAFQGTPFSATYSATKSFVQNFAEALHFELRSEGIDVLASAPGPVQSGFAKRAKMTMTSAATPEEVAWATLEALGCAVTVRPGFLSKFLGYSLLTMNRWGRIQIMKKIMQGMSKG